MFAVTIQGGGMTLSQLKTKPQASRVWVPSLHGRPGALCGPAFLPHARSSPHSRRLPYALGHVRAEAIGN